MQLARRSQKAILEAAVAADPTLADPMKIASLENEIAQGDFIAGQEVSIELNDSEKTQFSNEWRT
jgi:hypothetical protein